MNQAAPSEGVRARGELVELTEVPRDPALYNPDLEPTRAAERTWSRWNLAALWVGMSVCVPTYMLAGSLVSSGMSWWQAMIAIGLGNLLVLVPMILNGHAGTRYGIPFPVFARAAFGTTGAHVPSLARALVACAWFGIQTYIGGEALSAMIGLLWPGWMTLGGEATFVGLALHQWIAFLAFWLLNVVFVWRGTESIKWLENLAAPFLLAVGLALLWWATDSAGGLTRVLGEANTLEAGPKELSAIDWFVSVFLAGVTAMVGFWATLSLNIPDFTRYCRSQREQVLGQLFGLPTTMMLFSFVGVVVTAATVILFGRAIWDPVELVTELATRSGSTSIAFFAMLILAVATLSTNIAANIVSPANSFANAFPSKVNFRAGGMIAATLGVLMCPWLILSELAGWLVSYSGLLGPVGGVLVADYWLVRRTELDLAGLYRSDGPYAYKSGVNPAALRAMLAGIAVVLVGKLGPAVGVGSLEFLWTGAWFTGFGVSAAVYVLAARSRA
ncbi:MAG: NCS1 family nucleobase:cation symporter-1 [Nannocystaceae bacterium]